MQGLSAQRAWFKVRGPMDRPSRRILYLESHWLLTTGSFQSIGLLRSIVERCLGQLAFPVGQSFCKPVLHEHPPPRKGGSFSLGGLFGFPRGTRGVALTSRATPAAASPSVSPVDFRSVSFWRAAASWDSGCCPKLGCYNAEVGSKLF